MPWIRSNGSLVAAPSRARIGLKLGGLVRQHVGDDQPLRACVEGADHDLDAGLDSPQRRRPHPAARWPGCADAREVGPGDCGRPESRSSASLARPQSSIRQDDRLVESMQPSQGRGAGLGDPFLGGFGAIDRGQGGRPSAIETGPSQARRRSCGLGPQRRGERLHAGVGVVELLQAGRDRLLHGLDEGRARSSLSSPLARALRLVRASAWRRPLVTAAISALFPTPAGPLTTTTRAAGSASSVPRSGPFPPDGRKGQPGED